MADLIDETLTPLSFQGHLKLLILQARNPADNVAVELDNTDIYIVCQVQDKATAFATNGHQTTCKFILSVSFVKCHWHAHILFSALKKHNYFIGN